MAKLISIVILLTAAVSLAVPQILEVKAGKNAIVKVAPTGDAEQFSDRLSTGTRVQRMGESGVYYDILLADGRRGWSYKGNFTVVSETESLPAVTPPTPSPQSLLARPDVLKIIVIDVEVGDATLIICPQEGGKRDIILIDAGENDDGRIREELINNGIPLSGTPIRRFIITHYDYDHFGGAPPLVPLAEVVYDHGDNNRKSTSPMDRYLDAVNAPGTDRRRMTLNYQETFSGGVSVECVAVNKATDFDPNTQAEQGDDNPNSIALVVSYNGFDYFTAGDLTLEPEQSLAGGIKNCDVYHVDHHGSKVTSSHLSFVTKLDPEVSIASNGTRHGHPTKDVAKRLLDLGSKFYQTNMNPDSRAHQPDAKFVADDSYHEDDEVENEDGALGTIRIVVEPTSRKYFVLMPGLPLNEATFSIE